MRPWTAFPAIVLIACMALTGVLWTRASGKAPQVDPQPRTGMELLQAYRCRSGETKRIVLRGAEDNFSVAGEEPMRIRDGLRTARVLSRTPSRGYDETEPDHWLLDYMETPSRISRGLFVISLKAIADDENDLFILGDSTGSGERELLTTRIVDLPSRPEWRRLGDVRYAEFAEIRFNNGDARRGAAPPPGSPATLLEFVRARQGTAVVDVQVQDDTSVDFMGVAVCEQPPSGMGMTYTRNVLGAPEGHVALTCWSVPEGEYVCQPSKGDTPCATALPVACFRGREAPVPAALAGTTVWSGGDIAFSEPVPGSRFSRIAEVDAFCSARFGRGWRTATFHDGLGAGTIVARGDPSSLKGRAWVDIQDQPYGTCWKR